MHDAVTNPSSSTNFYSDDIVSPNQTKSPVSLNPTSRDMLSPSASSRRVQATAANSGRHWRYINGTGQLVDSSGDWDLSDELVKLQIADSNGDPNAQMRTPPQPKANVGVVGLHEASPLETASEASVDSGSPIPNEQSMGFASHSRGSSADTTASSHVSSASQTLRAGPYTPMKVAPVAESRNRPHSYSGGISAADLSRLQNAGGSPGAKGDSWSSPNRTPERQAQAEQPTYPSLVNQNGYMQSEDVQADYTQQQRRFSPATGPALQYNRPANVITNQPYRQPPPRGFNPQVQVPGVVSSPTNFAYTTPIAPPPPMPLSSSQQQLYDMMLATPPLDNPTMVRLQQQHNSFRGGHQHSASDPASLRDPATLALINSSMQQAFAAGQMYPPTMPPPPALAMFANQFYGAPQEAYPNAELAMMARLQAQYSGAYGVPVPAQGGALSQAGASGPSSAEAQAAANAAAGNGPSANNRKLGLYKTELCRSWEEKGSCRYGTKCQFAHGEEELRKVQRHPKYKTEICRTFWVSGSCPYGKRCCFIHTELPASGAPPGSEGAPPPSNPDTRPRSGSTNSDPNEMSTSLLARISAKRNQEGALNGGPGSVSTTPPSAGFGARPGSLRVDTSVIDTTSTKQNKSAYPTFAHNGILMPAGEDAPAMSPGPVTAAPDFGRHASARLDIVGAHQRIAKTSNVNPNVRHSFSGSEVQLDFNNVTTPTAANQYGQSPSDAVRPSRINGHVRSGSAGNWGSATRSAHLSAYPLSSIPGGELKANSPWADYNVSSRMTEKTWA